MSNFLEDFLIKVSALRPVIDVLGSNPGESYDNSMFGNLVPEKLELVLWLVVDVLGSNHGETFDNSVLVT